MVGTHPMRLAWSNAYILLSLRASPTLQGYLAHKKHPPLLGPYSRTIPRVLWWSFRGGLFLRARYLCTDLNG